MLNYKRRKNHLMFLHKCVYLLKTNLLNDLEESESDSIFDIQK